MDINKIAFLSLGFGDERYINQLQRLQASILGIYENANLFFWSNSLPATSKPHNESNYGFKVHAVQEALEKGFNKIIWLDPAMMLVKKELEYYDEILKRYPVIAVMDDNKLINYINDKCKNYFGIDDNWLIERDARLVGGSFYYFDFENDLATRIFQKWKNSEQDGIFGSSNEDIGMHRQDETCLALSLYQNESSPLPYSESRYNWCENPIFIKEHFK
jgi:hypothetical protein